MRRKNEEGMMEGGKKGEERKSKGTKVTEGDGCEDKKAIMTTI